MNLTRAELNAYPNYWMLAFSESDKDWLNRHGYPSEEEEAKLSQASLENLQALAESGNLNARIHLALRHANGAIAGGDPKKFAAARRDFDQALMEGGPFQAAKTVAFFINLANNRKAYGDLDQATLNNIQTHLLPFYQTARGLSAAYGDFGAIRVANRPYEHDASRILGLPIANADIPFDLAMRQFSNMNTSRMQRGLPAFDLERRPGEVRGLGMNETYVVFSR
jgi:hypothetical protein